jgi:hypothetical protein
MINRPEGLIPRQRLRRILPIDRLSELLAQARKKLAGARDVGVP